MDSVLTARIGADLSDLKSKMNEAHGLVGNFQDKIAEVGAVIAGAFAAEKIIEFGKEAVMAGAAAVDIENKLLVALHGREDVQKRLLSQAENLAGTTLFDDDAIVKQQALLAAMGKNESQIKRIIEAAVQLSAATGSELGVSVEALNKSYEGLDRGLKAIDPSLHGLTKAQLEHGDAVTMVMQKYKGFAEQLTEVGTGPMVQFDKQIEDIEKSLGKLLLPAVNSALKSISDTLKGLTAEDVSPWEKLGAIFTPGGLASVGILADGIKKAKDAVGADEGGPQGFRAAMKAGFNTAAGKKGGKKSAGLVGAGMMDTGLDYGSGITGFSGTGFNQDAVDMAQSNIDEMKAANDDYLNYLKDSNKQTEDILKEKNAIYENAAKQTGQVIGSQLALAISGQEDFATALENVARSAVGSFMAIAVASAIKDAVIDSGGNPFVAATMGAAAGALVSGLFANLGTSHFTPSLNTSYGATRGLANGATQSIQVTGMTQVSGPNLNTWWSNVQQQNAYTKPGG